ncbi:MAG TPA: ANTAR domain-containing protein [Candidatus Faecousia excrementigallinarum]|uniref:ANTAR domain-containing protein n=1 Tax=Candidatus Faecousia excrementigallinarum TaxID=2840806 RepID=A0A9D0Z437_9FIRM|nr:ANTAR domain-containing protein [Candidatus Faecousia excrementigallinarum]
MVFQEKTYCVLVVSSTESFGTSMAPLLPPTDYYPVVYARSSGEAQRLLAESSYDIVIINTPLSDDFGLGLACYVSSNTTAGVLLLVKNDRYTETSAKVLSYGVLTLPKPTSSQMITQTLGVLCATRERLRQMEEKQLSVEQKMEEIRLVNRAKWLLIETLGMSESDAHRYIEKQAMDLRISKAQVAKNIIHTYQG